MVLDRGDCSAGIPGVNWCVVLDGVQMSGDLLEMSRKLSHENERYENNVLKYSY